METYNEISASAPFGSGFHFMPFPGIDFLKKNSSNYLHIRELFLISLSLSLSHT